jgi:diguanylate cyclase (GGDEF)-like protein
MSNFESFKLVKRISKLPVCLVTLTGKVLKSNDLFREIEPNLFQENNYAKTIISKHQTQFLNYLARCYLSSELLSGSIAVKNTKYSTEGAKYGDLDCGEKLVLLYIKTKDDSKNNIDILNKVVDLELQISKQSRDDENKELNQSNMFQLANFDHLTKLANKGYFTSILDRAFKRCKRENQKLFLLFCDIDDFKNVNDTFGHFTGDKLLQHIATNLETVVRDTDIVGRFGGDEFVVLLENINETTDMPRIISRIENIFATPIKIDSNTTYTTISIGVAEYPGDGENTSELLKNADMAVYNAKKIIGNAHCYFSRELRLQMEKFYQIETKLRLALRTGVISIYYQPQFNIKTMQIIGIEALCRCKDADLGDIPPSVFLPIAEKTGLIKSLNDYIVDLALSDFAKKLKEESEIFENIKLSINIPKYVLSDKAAFNELIKLVNKKTNDANQVCLEIAESNFISKPHLSLQALQEANNNGVYSAIDNFGPGLVSLDLLKRLPSAVLKIDISFIQQICKSHNDFLIIKSLCILGKSLGMDVIAEGIETESQLNKLKQTSCKGAQGFLLAHPMPLDKLLPFIKERNTNILRKPNTKQTNEFYN